MTLDAVIIADSGTKSFSGTNPLKLNIDGHVADIQTVLNFIENNGEIKQPIKGSGEMSWASAHKLNGIYLLSYLNDHGFRTQLIDSFFDRHSEFEILLNENPLAVVISTTFITSYQTLVEMVKEIRNSLPQTKIIIGGPFVYASYLIYQRSQEKKYLPDQAKQDFLFTADKELPLADLFIIDPQGEQILCKALEMIKEKRNFSGLPNTATLKSGMFRFAERNNLFIAEDHIIEWDKLPDDVFKSAVVPLQASKGCPFSCAFCNFVKDRRMTSVKPLDSLIFEMKQVRSRGARYVWFVDDNFRLGRSDLEDVCQRFIRENIGLKWMTFIRASTLDTVDPELLKKAGCIEVQLGLESADNQILKNMNKRATLELYNRVLNKILSSGIDCSCYLIFGFPGETEESIRRTIDFMRYHENQNYPGFLTWSIFPFILAPLSPVYEKDSRTKYNLTGHMNHWRHATMDSEKTMVHVIQAFMEIENSGPIYRDDNQEILRKLDHEKRKHFNAIRHNLSKKGIKSKNSKSEILLDFNKVFKLVKGLRQNRKLES